MYATQYEEEPLYDLPYAHRIFDVVTRGDADTLLRYIQQYPGCIHWKDNVRKNKSHKHRSFLSNYLSHYSNIQTLINCLKQS